MEAPPHTPRAWRCDAGWLVWRGPPAQPLPDWAPLRRASGDPLPGPPADFWVIGHDGRVARRYESTAWSVEDELGATAFVVADGELLEIGMSARFSGPEEIRESAPLRDLRAVDDGDADAWRRIDAAVERELAARADAAERARQEGVARVAAVPGALDDYGAGDDFRRAHDLLRGRLAAFPSPTAEALLRALAAFGALHRALDEAPRAALGWAMEPFLAACRVAANDPGVPALKRREWPATDAGIAIAPAEDRPALRQLAASVAGVHAELVRHAGWAEDTDAGNTAIQLRQAAAAVDASRARLERIAGDGGGEWR